MFVVSLVGFQYMVDRSFDAEHSLPATTVNGKRKHEEIAAGGTMVHRQRSWVARQKGQRTDLAPEEAPSGGDEEMAVEC